MLYYVRQAFAPFSQVTSRSSREVLTEMDVATANLVVVADATAQANTVVLRRRLESGRTVLLAMRTPEAAATLRDLAGAGSFECREVETGRHALLESIDFKHPVLAPFSDPRFGDFTHIHFWKYRNLDLANHPQARVLARFDGDAPAWLEIPVGRGSLLVWTSGWGPSDSDLALSSKFVPLLYSILEHGGTLAERQSQYFVADSVPTPSSPGMGLRIHRPDNAALEVDGNEPAFTRTALPGIYTVESAAGTRVFAVNLAPGESRTELLAVEDIERMGIPLQPVSDVAPLADGQAIRHSSFAQMESQQKLWRWVLTAALALLLIEIWLGGWLTRSGPASEGEQP